LVLAISSAIFYAFNSVQHLALLSLSIVVNWLLAGRVARSHSMLTIDVAANFALLFVFKYSAFTIDQLRMIELTRGIGLSRFPWRSHSTHFIRFHS
jgi:D-alanyl-lipoteichoic acid acyltransferase DltB (MBOAT superfamily)